MDAEVFSELARLEQLHAAGQLSDAEFAAARNRLITDPGAVLPSQRNTPAAPTILTPPDPWGGPGGPPPQRRSTAEVPPGAIPSWPGSAQPPSPLGPPPGPPPGPPGPLGPPPETSSGNAWLWWVLAALLVVALVVAGLILRLTVWGPDRAQSQPPAPTTHAAPSTSASASGSASASASGSASASLPGPATRSPQVPSASATALRPTVVTADSTAPASVDDGGARVTYDAANLVDGKADTAWRTPGDATGQSLHFSFGRPVHLASVGLLPGYAKADASTGADRFTQNRRVVAVSWQTDDGTTVVQDLRDERSVQTTPLDATTTGLTMTILATTPPGDRDFTAISEVAFTGIPG